MKSLIVLLLMVLISGCGGAPGVQDMTSGDLGGDILPADGADLTGDGAGDQTALPGVNTARLRISAVGADGTVTLVGLAGALPPNGSVQLLDVQGNSLGGPATASSDGAFVLQFKAAPGALITLRPSLPGGVSGTDAQITVPADSPQRLRAVNAALTVAAAKQAQAISVSSLLGAAPAGKSLVIGNLANGAVTVVTTNAQGDFSASLTGSTGAQLALFVLGADSANNSQSTTITAKSGVFPMVIAPLADGSGDSLLLIPAGTLKPGSGVSVTLTGTVTLIAQGQANQDGGLAVCLSGVGPGQSLSVSATGPADEALSNDAYPLVASGSAALTDFVGTLDGGGAITINAKVSQVGGLAVVANCDTGSFSVSTIGSDGSITTSLSGDSGDSGGLFTLFEGDATKFKNLQSLIFTIPRPKPDLNFITASFPNASGQSLLLGLGSNSVIAGQKPSPWGVLQQALNEGISAVMPNAELVITVNNQTYHVPDATLEGSFAIVLENVAPGQAVELVQVVNGLPSDPVSFLLPIVPTAAPKTQLMAIGAYGGTITVRAMLGSVLPNQTLLAANVKTGQVRVLQLPFHPKPPANEVPAEVTFQLPGEAGDALHLFAQLGDQSQHSVFVVKAAKPRDFAFYVSGYNSDPSEKFVCVSAPSNSANNTQILWSLTNVTDPLVPVEVQSGAIMPFPNGVLWAGVGPMLPGLSYSARFRGAEDQTGPQQQPELTFPSVAPPQIDIQGSVFVTFVTTPAGLSAQVGIDPVKLPQNGAYLLIIQALTGEQAAVLVMDRVPSVASLMFSPPATTDEQHLFYFLIDLNQPQLLDDPGKNVLPASRCEHHDFKPAGP